MRDLDYVIYHYLGPFGIKKKNSGQSHILGYLNGCLLEHVNHLMHDLNYVIYHYFGPIGIKKKKKTKFRTAPHPWILK